MAQVVDEDMELVMASQGLGTDNVVNLVDLLCQAHRHELQFDLVGLDLAHVEDVVDKAEHVIARELDFLDVVRKLLRASRPVLYEICNADDGIHRRADIVRHVGEKIALGVVGGLCLGARHLGIAHRKLKLLVLGVELGVDALETLCVLMLDLEHLALLGAQDNVNRHSACCHERKRKAHDELNRRVDELNGICRDIASRHQEDERPIGAVHATQGVVVLLVVKYGVRISDAICLKLCGSLVKGAAVQVPHLLQDAEGVVSPDRAVVAAEEFGAVVVDNDDVVRPVICLA